MRILTPAEVRQVTKVRNLIVSGDITGIDWYDEHDNLIDGFNLEHPENKELWLNILDLALQQNESLKKEWIGNV